MASHQKTKEMARSIHTVQDLTDDSTNITPVIGLSKPLSLRSRFIDRLAELIGQEIGLKEDVNCQWIKIYISPYTNSPQNSLDEISRELASKMSIIAKQSEGPANDRAREHLWKNLMTYASPNVNTTISSLQRVFQSDEEAFKQFLANYFMPEDGSTADQELGNQLLLLYQAATTHEKSKEISTLIKTASTMTRVLMNLRDRLKYLLGKTKLADELYELICQLGFTERVYHTIIRAAYASESFRNVTFHLGSVTSPPKTHILSSPRSHHPVKAKPSPERAPALPTQPQLLKVASQPSTTKLCTVIDIAQTYLAQEDRDQMLHRLQPATKRYTAQLVGTVLQDKLLPVDTEAWYAFGFVTAENEQEERQLAGLYSVLLKEGQDPQKVFCELQGAVETNTLTTLFDSYNYQHFRGLFPRLEAFLRTPAEKCSTVWRLRQFILDLDETEPPAYAQRDFGFRYCQQREEVLLLKEIYRNICKKMSPRDLHTACVHGRLFEAAIQKGICIDAKHKRLLQNDYPSPYLGYDNDKGTDNYRRPFFKKPLKV